jgi:hypothetical protein
MVIWGLMKTHLYGGLMLACLLVSCGGASDYEPPQLPPPPPPPPAPQAEPAPLPEPYAPATPSAPPPPPVAPAGSPPAAPTTGSSQPAGEVPPDQFVYSYPTGQWVYTAGYGWVWVPAGAATEEMEGAPYAYLYTPAYGWTWYVSPWGWGPYHYGIWVRHPWHPVGLHGYWVAHPRVVVRFGRGHYHH